jgi:hypothetical protein
MEQDTLHCPKCKFEQDAANTECVRCGLLFEKYKRAKKSHSKTSETTGEDISETADQSATNLFSLLFFTRSPVNRLYFAGRIITFLIILVWGITFVIAPIESNKVGRSLMHFVNLPFHEFGHIIFRPFGRFMTSLGGSLGQLLMPLVCLGVLLIQTRDPFGASVSLWWFGENLFDLAPYINDARSLTLPLLGGNVGHSSPYGFHDWEFILAEMGLLRYDHFLAKMAVVMGTLVFIVSFVWGGLLLFKQYKKLA